MILRFETGGDYFARPESFYEGTQASYISCPHCDGDGGVWFDADGRQIDKRHYTNLSDEDKELCTFSECEYCEGLGTVEDYND